MRLSVATYRLQLHKDFGFSEVRQIVGYLSDLGISDVYASPIFKSRKGSLHGYDVTNPGELNPELGGLSGFEETATEVRERGMGWIQDIVPNHMAFHGENDILRDVLENGRRSPYFEHFDVWWDHPYTGMRGRLLAPFLGSFFGEALEKGEIRLLYDENGFSICYYDLSFPLKIEAYSHVLTHRLEDLRKRIGRNNPEFIDLLGILYSLRILSSQESDEESLDHISFIKNTLWEIYTRCGEIRALIDENVGIFNGEKDPGDRTRRLAPLLSEQMFRLSFWKVATEEINYRRFFSINDLISLRVERERVFSHVHALITKLVRDKKITGLRVDHIDGLYDPEKYLRRLRQEGPETYLVVEKILDTDEELPLQWPVHGTTGYDFMNQVNGVFCRRENERPRTRGYFSFTGLKNEFGDLVLEKKKLILERHMTGDIDNLALQLKDLASRDRYGSDITLYGLKRALAAVMASFPVYRTYVRAKDIRQEDRVCIKKAVEKARATNPGLMHELDFVERFLLLEHPPDLPEEEQGRRLGFVMRFQQFTGPLMAKGFEDTALYVYNRLLSLNEGGESPGRFGVPIERFHAYNQSRVKNWPHALSATSTHDTKRGEDVRARINALSEIPDEWDNQLRVWSRINRKRRKRVGSVDVPDRNDEYFLYQTLVGAWPFDERGHPEFVQRIRAYIIKAVREAKVHTAWLKPDEDYEKAYISFLDDILEPGSPFLEAFLPFQRKIAHCGVYTGLSQALIKITAPGVPDFYQGCDLWDLNLVDPDNRRPVDYEKRKGFLEECKAKAADDALSFIGEMLATKEDGRIKLYLIYRALHARKEKRALFQEGDYIPLETAGPFKDHVISFARRKGGMWAVTVAPRFFFTLEGESTHPLGEAAWRDTALLVPEQAPENWKNALTGEEVGGRGRLPLAEILRAFPAALLVSEDNL